MGAVDAPGDPPRASLFAQLEEHVRELVVREAVDELERGLAARRVHAHVDGAFMPKAHAAKRIVDLRRADAEICAEPLHLLDAARLELVPRASEGFMDRDEALAEPRQALGRRLDGHEIAIEPDDASTCVRLENGLRVTTAAQGGVDVDTAVRDGQCGDDLTLHDRGVVKALHDKLLFFRPDPLVAEAGQGQLRIYDLRRGGGVTAHRPSSARRWLIASRSSSLVSQKSRQLPLSQSSAYFPLPAQITSFTRRA